MWSVHGLKVAPRCLLGPEARFHVGCVPEKSVYSDSLSEMKPGGLEVAAEIRQHESRNDSGSKGISHGHAPVVAQKNITLSDYSG
ncbi:hypothetical protein SAY87_013873 [Trapa incisa]|uniref:Uncharacterized protein n=1 Tax=Trapa incisa TaxID=236973 RepID=A0AAN7QGL9_9MYRT|nr:hypothetical protein SAY87_013873 [Trapa incisa]